MLSLIIGIINLFIVFSRYRLDTLSQGTREEAFLSSMLAFPFLTSNNGLIFLSVFGLIVGIIYCASGRTSIKAIAGAVINIGIIFYLVFAGSQSLEQQHNQNTDLLDNSGIFDDSGSRSNR